MFLIYKEMDCSSLFYQTTSMLDFSKVVMENKKRKWKSEGTNFGVKMQSHYKLQMKSQFSHIGRRKEIVVLILGNTFFSS